MSRYLPEVLCFFLHKITLFHPLDFVGAVVLRALSTQRKSSAVAQLKKLCVLLKLVWAYLLNTNEYNCISFQVLYQCWLEVFGLSLLSRYLFSIQSNLWICFVFIKFVLGAKKKSHNFLNFGGWGFVCLFVYSPLTWWSINKYLLVSLAVLLAMSKFAGLYS